MRDSIPAAVPAGVVPGRMMSRYWFIEWPGGSIDGLVTPRMMTAEEALQYMIDRYCLQPVNAWPAQEWQLHAALVDIY